VSKPRKRYVDGVKLTCKSPKSREVGGVLRITVRELWLKQIRTVGATGIRETVVANELEYNKLWKRVIVIIENHNDPCYRVRAIRVRCSQKTFRPRAIDRTRRAILTNSQTVRDSPSRKERTGGPSSSASEFVRYRFVRRHTFLSLRVTFSRFRHSRTVCHTPGRNANRIAYPLISSRTGRCREVFGDGW